MQINSILFLITFPKIWFHAIYSQLATNNPSNRFTIVFLILSNRLTSSNKMIKRIFSDWKNAVRRSSFVSPVHRSGSTQLMIISKSTKKRRRCQRRGQGEKLSVQATSETEFSRRHSEFDVRQRDRRRR